MKTKFYKNILLIITLIILFFLYFIVCAKSYSVAVFSNIENSVFRLHVIANSDSQKDQYLKYLVRDALLDYMNKIAKDATSKEEVIKIANENLDIFKNIALNVIKENDCNYNVNVSIGNFEFPVKKYGDISLPSGYYDALKIEIGQAKGQNWWCVMFPPLCFVDISSGVVPEDSKSLMHQNLSEEEYLLISSNSKEVQFKLKILELFSNNNSITAKK